MAGVVSLGLSTTVLPAAMRRGELPDRHHHRVVPRRHLGAHADRLAPHERGHVAPCTRRRSCPRDGGRRRRRTGSGRPSAAPPPTPRGAPASRSSRPPARSVPRRAPRPRRRSGSAPATVRSASRRAMPANAASAAAIAAIDVGRAADSGAVAYAAPVDRVDRPRSSPPSAASTNSPLTKFWNVFMCCPPAIGRQHAPRAAAADRRTPCQAVNNVRRPCADWITPSSVALRTASHLQRSGWRSRFGPCESSSSAPVEWGRPSSRSRRSGRRTRTSRWPTSTSPRRRCAVATATNTEGDRIVAAYIDASSEDSVAELARSMQADVILNACDPRFNPPIFNGAFAAGCNYVDMAMNLSVPTRPTRSRRPASGSATASSPSTRRGRTVG